MIETSEVLALREENEQLKQQLQTIKKYNSEQLVAIERRILASVSNAVAATLRKGHDDRSSVQYQTLSC